MTLPQYADISLVRRLSGNPDPSDIGDDMIAAAISYGSRHVDSETAKSSGWTDVNDPVYPIVVEATEFFSAAYIQDHFFAEELKSDRLYQKALDLCLTIRESSPGSLILASAPYRTYPLNLNAKIYRSLPGSADASNRRVVFGDDSDTVSP